MAQYYLSLEEAAKKLGLSVPDFKRRLRTEWTHIRPLQDGSTQRFRPSDVEELGKQIGMGSDEEFQLVDPSSDEMPLQLHLAEDEPRTIKAPSSKKLTSPIKKKNDEDEAVLRLTHDELDLGDPDVFLLADEPQTKKMSSKKMKPVAKTDSDVRLAQSGKIKRPVLAEPSDEIELDILPEGGSSSKLSGVGKISSASSGRLTPTSKVMSPKSAKLPAITEADSSEFELNLDAASSDEFELSLANDDSDEISLGQLPEPSSSDSKAGLASGINIGKPRNLGLSLEKRGDGRSSIKLGAVKLDGRDVGRSSKKLPAVKPGADDEIDFELSLDQPGTSSKKLRSTPKIVADDSEFDLTLDEPADLAADLDESTGSFGVAEERKNDIFETDFEIPALDDDSASEAVAIDEADTDLESSDFDLAIDDSGEMDVEEESGSQVVVLDDEEMEAPKRKKTGKKKKAAVEVDEDVDIAEDGVDFSSDAVSFDDMELDESVSASKALRGQHRKHDDEERVLVVHGQPWGIMPALVMLPTVFIMFIGGLMAYEMMHSMWGYHQPNGSTSLVIDKVAETLDIKQAEPAAVPKKAVN